MKDSEYQEIIRNMPCSFTRVSEYGLVSWHHVRGIRQAGGGSKPPPWAAIPVAAGPHNVDLNNCHNYGITRHEQKMALLATWMENGEKAVGVEKFWAEMGGKFWELMNE